MRILLLLSLLLTIIVGSAWSQSIAYVMTTKDNVRVFAHNPVLSGEKPIFVADSEEWLMVVEKRADKLKVTDMKANVGWIDYAAVKPNISRLCYDIRP